MTLEQAALKLGVGQQLFGQVIVVSRRLTHRGTADQTAGPANHHL